ncbi:hypothetical protein Tco_0751750 [Tanacetum coccineum]|uniref:Uncharacterized protein n=1 Tax=Tanacetum coccineum TaxID=301880 RepID=A0ABQ4Z4W7_9ASTR
MVFGECRHRYAVFSLMDTAYWLSEHAAKEIVNTARGYIYCWVYKQQVLDVDASLLDAYDWAICFDGSSIRSSRLMMLVRVYAANTSLLLPDFINATASCISTASLVLGWDKDSIKLKKAVFGFIEDVITKTIDYHLFDVVVEFHRTTCGMSPVAPMALLRVTSCKAEMSTAGDRTVRGDRDRAVDIARGRVDSSIAKLSSEIACARRWSVARRAREKYTNNNYLREINYSVDEDSRRVAADLRSSDSQYLECAYLTAAIQLAAIAKELIVIVLAACGIIMPPNTASADSVVGVYDELRAEARSQGRGSEYSDASGSRFTVSGGDGLSARCGGEVVVGRVINPSPRDLYLGDKSERSEDARHRGIEWVLSMLSCAGSYARARRFRIAYTTGYDQQYEAKNRCISSLVNTTQILED